MECILLLSRSVRVAGSGWVAGVEDRIPRAEAALELKTRSRCTKCKLSAVVLTAWPGAWQEGRWQRWLSRQNSSAVWFCKLRLKTVLWTLPIPWKMIIPA